MIYINSFKDEWEGIRCKRSAEKVLEHRNKEGNKRKFYYNISGE